jgi:FkbM family methyltransferase
MKKSVNWVLSFFGLVIVRTPKWRLFLRLTPFLKVSSLVPQTVVQQLAACVDKSHSQIGQDLVALVTSNFKNSGFFVEFGATNGKDLSNTYLLEKEFSWTGILAEPATFWQSKLQENRNCILDFRCVTNRSGEQLDFMEVQDVLNQSHSAELSTLEEFTDNGDWASKIRNGLRYKVETISLLDLLIEHNAPRYVDYISIDTEGSEFLILRDFDFSQFEFGFISVEHNFTKRRTELFNLLILNGYVRIWSEISEFDDWFVSQDVYLDLAGRGILAA